MYENEVKNKPLLKFLKKQVSDWQGPNWKGGAGELFLIYHEIMMLYNAKLYITICKKYWNTFFPIHIVPDFIITDDAFDINYEKTAEKILDVCVKDLAHNLQT
jgi:hypothetical protein